MWTGDGKVGLSFFSLRIYKLKNRAILATLFTKTKVSSLQVFFYNPSTKTSVWERPPEMYGRQDVDVLVSRCPEVKKGWSKALFTFSNCDQLHSPLHSDEPEKENNTAATAAAAAGDSDDGSDDDEGEDGGPPKKKSRSERKKEALLAQQKKEKVSVMWLLLRSPCRDRGLMCLSLRRSRCVRCSRSPSTQPSLLNCKLSGIARR